jgi:hypothetical protein
MRFSRFVPVPIKELIKDGLRHRAIRAALKPLKAHGTMTPQEIAAFRQVWQNDNFAADHRYLTELLARLNWGPVLECGTGATTMLANELGLKGGFTTYCLEQDLNWARRVKEFNPRAVNIIDAPLRNYGSYHWYDVRVSLPAHFPLIVCDGPYIARSLGEPSYSSWRYGLLPWLKQNGKTFGTALLDDVNDPRGPPILERWIREFGVRVQRIESGDGEMAVVTA